MPAAIAMASTAKISPMLPVSSKHASSSSCPSSLSTSSPTSVSSISIPVSAFHDPTSNIITITPYFLLKTATVAEQMQALRQDKKIGKPPEQPAGALRVKRRTDLSKLGLPDAKPASVSRRNARERNRVKQVNLGFETLREHVPNGKKNKKMSKVQTLRSAAQYIKDLYMILHGELPALGSPNVVDEHEPNSPLDNSLCSMSDNDTDVNVNSPEPKLQHIQQQLQQQIKQAQEQQVIVEQDVSHESPVPTTFSQARTCISPPQQLIPKSLRQATSLKEAHLSVLQQQLSRGQMSHRDCISNEITPQQIAHKRQQDEQEQIEKQVQHKFEEQTCLQHQLTLYNFDPAALRLDPLTCSRGLALANNNRVLTSILSSSGSGHTFTQLSPMSVVDDQCHGYVGAPPEPTLTTAQSDSLALNTNSRNENMDVPTAPSLLQAYIGDVNMNVIETNQTDFDALQGYFKSIQNEHFKTVEPTFVIEPKNKNAIINCSIASSSSGPTSNLVHSPATSLCSTTSTASSEADVCASRACDYDNYDNLDKEALLDISNWISELCSQGMHANDVLPGQQQAALAFSH